MFTDGHKLFLCGLLLSELVAKLLLALAQIRFVSVRIDERIRVAAEQTFVFLHEMKKLPCDARKMSQGKWFSNAKDLSKSAVIPG